MRNKRYKQQLSMIVIVWMGFFCLRTRASFSSEPDNLIKNKCVICHDLNRVYLNKMSAKRWIDTIKRMQAKRKRFITDQEVREIADSLIVNNPVDQKLLFEKRCLDCHERGNKVNNLRLKKTISGWQRAIERMRKKYCMFIGIDEAEEITVYWTNPENNKNLKLNEDEYDRLQGNFENKCGACHSYNFLYNQKHSPAAWNNILIKMKRKNPIILKDSDLKDIPDYLLQTESLLVK